MFEHHFGLRENPFVAGHHAKFVYPSPEHQEALAHLRFGIENREPFVLITGEVGTGKTTALYDALSEWQSRVVVALINNSALNRNELLEEIALRFGVAISGPISKPQVLAQLEKQLFAIHQRGERAILLLDEAQNLDRDVLEEIRLLSNLETVGQKLLQVFLVGQPELEAKLARPELRQLRQRITVHYRLNPLNPDDTERYIHHRLTVAGGHALTVFPSESCLEVHWLTHGIPREINNVCGQAMLNAFVEDSRVVLPQHVRAAASETEFKSVIKDEQDRLDAQASQIHGPGASTSAASPAPPAAMTAAPLEAAPPPIEEAAWDDPRPTPRNRGKVEVAAPPTEELETPSQAEHPHEEPPMHIPAIDEWMSSFASAQRKVPSAEPQAPAAPAPIAPPPSVVVPASPPPAPAPEPIIASSMAPFLDPEAPPDLPTAAQLAQAQAAQVAPPPRPEPVHREEPLRRTAPVAAPIAAAPQPVAPKRSLEAEQLAALPPRLRAKIEDNEFEEETVSSGGGSARWLLPAAAAVVLGIAGVLAMRFGPWAKHAPASPTASVTPIQEPKRQGAPPPAPSAAPSNPAPAASAPATTPVAAAPAPPKVAATTPAPTKPQPSAVTASAAPSTMKPTSTPVKASTPKPVATLPAGAVMSPTMAAAPPKPAAPKSTYGVAVGTYLNEDRAAKEIAKLNAASGLPAKVLTVTEDGSEVYRVVLGAFSERAAADKAASDLIGKGLVDEARVIAMAAKKP